MAFARLAYAVGAICLTLVLRFLVKLVAIRRRMHHLPGPPHSWIWGSLQSMGAAIATQPKNAAPQTYPLIIQEKYKLGRTFYLDPWPFGPTIMVTTDPRVMDQMTVDESFPKAVEVAEFTRWFGGPDNMVAQPNGPKWKKWRAAFNPGFSASHLTANLLPVIVDQMAIFCELMAEKARKNELFRMETWATRLTVDIIGKVVLDLDLNSMHGQNDLVDAFNSQTRWVHRGAQFQPSELWDIRRPIILRYNNWKIERYLSRVLDERFATRSQRGKSKHVIDLALEAYMKEVKGSHVDAAELKQIDPEFKKGAISNITIFLFAGHDTTSSTICYCYYFLSKNPDKLKRMRAEHDEVFGNDVDIAQKLKEDPYLTNKLEYTTAVVKEVLRLQPPASTVRAGTPDLPLRDPDTGEILFTDTLMLWPVDVGVHRHKDNWGDPHVFRPERWLPGGNGNKSAYIPFSKGSRNCIGQELAMLEIRIVLAMTVRSWDFESRYDEIKKLRGDGTGYPCDTKGPQSQWGDEAYQVQLGTAKPREGMPCRLRLRTAM